jgi:hypothetical protein
MDDAWHDAWTDDDADAPMTVTIRHHRVGPEGEAERIDPPGGPVHREGNGVELIEPPADEESDPDG